MKNALLCLLAFSISPTVAVAVELADHPGPSAPPIRNPALYHYDKLQSALSKGNTKLARTHAKLRTQHLTLSYRFQSSFQSTARSNGEKIILDKPTETKLQAPAIRIPIVRIPAIRVQADQAIEEEMERIVEESIQGFLDLPKVDGP